MQFGKLIKKGCDNYRQLTEMYQKLAEYLYSYQTLHKMHKGNSTGQRDKLTGAQRLELLFI